MLIEQRGDLHANEIRRDLEREVLNDLLIKEAIGSRPTPKTRLGRLGRALTVIVARLGGEQSAAVSTAYIPDGISIRRYAE